MSPVFVLPCMLFMHVLDDFVLQTVVLSKLKQKSWWEANAPERGYRYDYLAALTAHAISWSFCIMDQSAHVYQILLTYLALVWL